MNNNEVMYKTLRDVYIVTADDKGNQWNKMGEWLNEFSYQYARKGFTDGYEQTKRFFQECQNECRPTYKDSSDDWVHQDFERWLDEAGRRDIITSALQRGTEKWRKVNGLDSGNGLDSVSKVVERKDWHTIDHSIFDTSRSFKWIPRGILCVSNFELCFAESGTGKSVFAMYQAALWGKGLAIIGTETDRQLAEAYTNAYGVDMPIRQYDPLMLFEVIGPNILDHYDFILSTWGGDLPMVLVEDQYEYVNEYVPRNAGKDFYSTENAQAHVWRSTEKLVKQEEIPLIAHSKMASLAGTEIKGNRKPYEVARVRRRITRDNNLATITVTGSAIGSEYSAELVTEWFDNNGIRTPYVVGVNEMSTTPDGEFLRSLVGKTYKGNELAIVYRHHKNPRRKWGQSAAAISRSIEEFKNFAESQGFVVDEQPAKYNAKSYTVAESGKLQGVGEQMKRKSEKLASTGSMYKTTTPIGNIYTSTFSLPPDSPLEDEKLPTASQNDKHFYEDNGEMVYGPERND